MDRLRRLFSTTGREPRLAFWRFQLWQQLAMTAAFRPTLRLPIEDNRLRQVVGATALVVALTAVRFATKLTDSFVVSFGVQGIALICIVAGIVWVTRGSDIDAQATPINSGVTL